MQMRCKISKSFDTNSQITDLYASDSLKLEDYGPSRVATGGKNCAGRWSGTIVERAGSTFAQSCPCLRTHPAA